jgi:hypothetical protein
MMLVFGGSANNARATGIATDLDVVRGAALSYENEHSTRYGDPLGLRNLNSENKEVEITSMVNEKLENPLTGYSAWIIRKDGRLRVAFKDFAVDPQLAAALDDFVERHRGDGYTRSVSGTDYTLMLLLK